MGKVVNSKIVKSGSSTPTIWIMIADEKAARQKNHEKQYVFRGFLLFFWQKQGIFTMERKILILCCLFAILEQKQDLNLYTIYI